jgi:hypothetical protein
MAKEEQEQTRRTSDAETWLHKATGPIFATLLTLAVAGSFTNYLDFISDRQRLATLISKVEKVEAKLDNTSKELRLALLEQQKVLIALRIKLASMRNP